MNCLQQLDLIVGSTVATAEFSGRARHRQRTVRDVAVVAQSMAVSQ